MKKSGNITNPHSVDVSKGLGRLLVAFQPAGVMKAFFEEFAKMTDPAPKEEMQQLFRSHGMEIVGAPL